VQGSVWGNNVLLDPIRNVYRRTPAIWKFDLDLGLRCRAENVAQPDLPRYSSVAQTAETMQRLVEQH